VVEYSSGAPITRQTWLKVYFLPCKSHGLSLFKFFRNDFSSISLQIFWAIVKYRSVRLRFPKARALKSSVNRRAKKDRTAEQRREVSPEIKAQHSALTAAQMELEDSRARYAELYDEAPVGYITMAESGGIRETNLAAARLLGYSRRQLIGQPLLIFIDREYRRKYLKFLSEIRRRTGRRSIEVKLARKPSDSPVFIEIISTASSGRKGPVLLQTALVDITARRLAEAELRESEERFRLLASHAPVGIFLCDAIGRNCYVNDYWCDMTGYTPVKAQGSGWLNAVHSDDRANVERAMREKMRKKTPCTLEFRLEGPSGGIVWVQSHAVPLINSEGKVSGWIGTVADITDRKRVETDLARAHTETLAASRAKDDFLAMLSHELRTPLNPVLLLASDDARDRELPPGVRADFDAIRRNVEMVARLIDDLLDITRITHGKLTLERQNVGVHEILRNAIAMMESDLQRKRIGLKLALHASRETVLGDAVRLHQVFLNILKNAIKFTPEEGTIFVESFTDGRNLQVKITDTGIGISQSDLETIFDAFCQGSQTNRGTLGLGLGLAISKRLIELHDGSIQASSAGKGRGATFSISLPIAVSAKVDNRPHERPAEPAPSPRIGSQPTRRSRILLVEDHEPTRAALTRLLLRRRFEVIGAGSVAEARSHVDQAQQEFDLLISDIGLPDGNGYDLMHQLRKDHKLEGIALTGYGMEEDVQRSHQAGFSTHLTKPIKIESLDQALAAVLPQA